MNPTLILNEKSTFPSLNSNITEREPFFTSKNKLVWFENNGLANEWIQYHQSPLMDGAVTLISDPESLCLPTQFFTMKYSPPFLLFSYAMVKKGACVIKKSCTVFPSSYPAVFARGLFFRKSRTRSGTTPVGLMSSTLGKFSRGCCFPFFFEWMCACFSSLYLE